MDNNNLFNIPGYYPTPIHLINKMLSGIDFKQIQSVLEPSAGDGNLIEQVKNKLKYSHSYGYNKEYNFDLDTIEINDNLRYILQGKGYRIVNDDYLSYNSYKRYDLIIMNPPFESGDKHLLKAISMQPSKIVCLLNAETLKNPYSNIRKDLLRKLEELNANIEYIQNAFYDAERKANVEIALIKIDIPKLKDDSIILSNLKQKEQYRIKNESSYVSDQLVSSDYIKGIIEQYNYEVQAGLKLIDEYNAMQPLLINSFDKDYFSRSPILKLSLERKDDDNNCSLANSYIKQVRVKYWWALFNNKEFMGLFTNNLRQKYVNKINKLKDYDFSFYNIYTIRIELSKEMVKGVEDTILALFDEFSHKHYWYDETSKNIHYFNGWKSNSCFKINKKVIIPLQGYRDLEYSWGGFKPTHYDVIDKLMDIEKVFNYLSVGTNINVEDIDLKQVLEFAQNYGDSKKIKTRYVTIDFYKKGTAHLTFNNEDLLHRFNIFGSQSKNWLPPAYGKKTYSEMDDEEKAVVDSFEGEISYKKVMDNQNDYILETNQLLMLA